MCIDWFTRAGWWLQLRVGRWVDAADWCGWVDVGGLMVGVLMRVGWWWVGWCGWVDVSGLMWVGGLMWASWWVNSSPSEAYQHVSAWKTEVHESEESSWLFCGSSIWDSLGTSWVLISDQKRLWWVPSSPYSSPAPELGPLCRNASLGKWHRDLSFLWKFCGSAWEGAQVYKQKKPKSVRIVLWKTLART